MNASSRSARGVLADLSVDQQADVVVVPLLVGQLLAVLLTRLFQPGDKLPSGPELAKRFGVARMTVQQAIRLLRDEGLVVSRQGSGVVCPGAVQRCSPEPDGKEAPLRNPSRCITVSGPTPPACGAVLGLADRVSRCKSFVPSAGPLTRHD